MLLSRNKLNKIILSFLMAMSLLVFKPETVNAASIKGPTIINVVSKSKKKITINIKNRCSTKQTVSIHYSYHPKFYYDDGFKSLTLNANKSGSVTLSTASSGVKELYIIAYIKSNGTKYQTYANVKVKVK